jgi:hypothetical protein
MTEEPMTREEIDNIILDDPEKTDSVYSTGIACHPDYQREHALRLAVDTFSGQAVTTLEITFRAQKFHDFLTGKPT